MKVSSLPFSTVPRAISASKLVQADVPAALVEDLHVNVRTLAGGRLQDQLGEARALVQVEERLGTGVEVDCKRAW